MNRPRAHRGREQQPTPQPEPETPPATTLPPASDTPKPPSAEGFEPITDPAPEQPPAQDPPPEPESGATPEPEQPADSPPAEAVDLATGEVVEAVATETVETQEEEEKPLHPLTDLQVRLREILDYDQITEVRLALLSRATELEKHIKKATDLGVFEEDARRRLRIIQGEATRFGLSRIFEREEATFQRDIFFDREKPNGRPEPEPEPTDAQVDDAVHEHVAELDQQEADAAALAQETGTAVDDPKLVIDPGDTSEPLGTPEQQEDGGGWPGVEEAQGRAAAEASGISA